MGDEMPKDIATELRIRAAIEQVEDSVFERAAAEIERLRAGLAAAIKQRDEARDYSIALQRSIEHHRRGVAVPPAIAANCPHHAQMLNEHLASKEWGGARGAEGLGWNCFEGGKR